MQAETFAIGFELLTELIGGDTEATPCLISKLLRSKNFRILVAHLQCLELVNLSQVLQGHFVLYKLLPVAIANILGITLIDRDIFAINDPFVQMELK